MKTQINNLRSGTANQITNTSIDYSKLNSATSHVGHAGTDNNSVWGIFSKVIEENKETMRIIFFEKEYTLTANWSASGKSVFYACSIADDDFVKIANNHHRGLSGKFYKVGKNKTASLIISGDCNIQLSNGNKYRVNICPSLITII